MKYTEKNRDVLKKAIAALPVYEAPSALWSDLESKLEQEQAYEQTIKHLPQYQAPPGLWESIEARLDEEPPKQIEVVHKKSAFGGFWRVAAVLIPLLTLGWWSMQYFNDSATYSYETAVVSMSMEEKSDDSLVEELKQMYKTNMKWSQDPRQERLWFELQELENALQEAKNNLGQYGEQQYLLKIVKSLEQDRTKVLKEMKEFI